MKKAPLHFAQNAENRYLQAWRPEHGSRAGQKRKGEKEKAKKEKAKKKTKEEVLEEIVGEAVDDGYDGYYDDILPPDTDRVKEGLDKELIKKIVALSIGVVFIISMCVVMLYVL